MPDLFTTADAELSACGRYRLSLSRRWDRKRPTLGWVMLNPSTADASVDDPTIRRCMAFAIDRRYGGIVVANLFTLRATDPTELRRADDPVGPDADRKIVDLFDTCTRVCAAWGVDGSYLGRDLQVIDLVRRHGFGNKLLCLGTTKDGHPRHPLYLPAGTPLGHFNPPRRDGGGR